MNETKWTRGPWEVDDISPYTRVNDSGRGDEIVDTAFASEIPASERLANAHLIAAAPTLYEAGEQSAIQLEEAANILEGNGLKAVASIFRMQVIKQRAALAKARGEAQ